MSSVIDKLDEKEQRKFRFTEFAENEENEIPNTEEYQNQIWRDLSERRRLKACVRCGWFEVCKIQEISKYHRYKIYSNFNWRPNTIDKDASKRGTDICLSCAQELISQEFLGSRSKRINKLTNRPAIQRKLKAVEHLCNALNRLQREYQRLLPRLESIKKNKPEHLTQTQFQDMVKDAITEVNYKATLIEKVKTKIDSLVSIYSIK